MKRYTTTIEDIRAGRGLPPIPKISPVLYPRGQRTKRKTKVTFCKEELTNGWWIKTNGPTDNVECPPSKRDLRNTVRNLVDLYLKEGVPFELHVDEGAEYAKITVNYSQFTRDLIVVEVTS